jgi:hypothetical protein
MYFLGQWVNKFAITLKATSKFYAPAGWPETSVVLMTPTFCSNLYDSLRIGNVRGSKPGGGEIFRTRPDRPWGPPSLLCNGFQLFPGGKAARAVALITNSSGAEVKGGV